MFCHAAVGLTNNCVIIASSITLHGAGTNFTLVHKHMFVKTIGWARKTINIHRGHYCIKNYNWHTLCEVYPLITGPLNKASNARLVYFLRCSAGQAVLSIILIEFVYNDINLILHYIYIYNNFMLTIGTVCLLLWLSRWRHAMEILSALLAICAGNSPVTDEFPAQRPVTWRFGVFFDLHLNERLSKQSWGRRSETPTLPLWRHRNGDFNKIQFQERRISRLSRFTYW